MNRPGRFWCAVLALTVLAVTAVVGLRFLAGRFEMFPARNYDLRLPNPVERLDLMVKHCCTFLPDWVGQQASAPHLYQGGGAPDASYWFAFTLPVNSIPRFKDAFPDAKGRKGRGTWRTGIPSGPPYSQDNMPDSMATGVPGEVAKWWYNGETPVEVYHEEWESGGGVWIIVAPNSGRVYGFWFNV